jgi:hypothetical protein
MILEGIVTTVGSDGAVNIAPMGPIVDENVTRLSLKPFRTARTYANLKARNEGVFHVTDDVLLFARAAVRSLPCPPPMTRANAVDGWILSDACRYYEFRVVKCDDRADRATLQADIVHAGRLRDFFGFNRAKHAVVEAAILATRTEFLPRTEIFAAFDRLAPLVEKCGGEREREAFAFLTDFVHRVSVQAEVMRSDQSPRT